VREDVLRALIYEGVQPIPWPEFNYEDLKRYPVYEHRQDHDIYHHQVDETFYFDETCEDVFIFDSYGNDCSAYIFERPCGFADSFEFMASRDCCACGGGIIGNSSGNNEDSSFEHVNEFSEPDIQPEYEPFPNNDKEKKNSNCLWFCKSNDDEEEENEDDNSPRPKFPFNWFLKSTDGSS
jgi:hypothetical protein